MVIDLSAIPINDPFAFAWWFFKTIGWIFPVFLIVYGMLLGFQMWIRSNYRKTRKYMILAIDIPKQNEQTLKAVENFFAHLSGAHMPLKFIHKWWKGEVPDSFSFEIVSIGGYIQYMVHFVDKYRDLIEAAIYAQYPDAEITEVPVDYTERWKNLTFPNDKYQLFGTELKLTNKDAYPLITYKEFEDAMSQELKDPLAGVLEAMGRLSPDEELWLSILVTPADNDWGKIGDAEVNKLIGAKSNSKKGLLDYLFDIPNIFIDALYPAPEGGSNSGGGKEEPNKLLYLTSGQRDTVSAIENKCGKIGFHTKIRYIYIAPKEKYSTVKAVQSFYGAFKQYNLGANGLKADSKYYTGAINFMKERRLRVRRKKMLYRYRWRGHWFAPGEYGFLLNTEELASLWHFPAINVKAPLLKKTDAKRAEPPTSLPVEQPEFELPTDNQSNQKNQPPSNLPT